MKLGNKTVDIRISFCYTNGVVCDYKCVFNFKIDEVICYDY